MKKLVVLTTFLSISGAGFAGSAVDNALKKAAKRVGVPHELLRAICYSESRLDMKAVAYSDGGGTNHALGLCQVLYSTAVGMGMKKDERCKEHIERKDREYANCRLYGPYTNAFYAAKVLRYQLKRYAGSWANATAAYNSGTVKTCGPKGYYGVRVFVKKTGNVKWRRIKCKPGGLMNHKYVDRVMKAMVEGK
jgi:soluble lytic murein transglycosylase-like protein